MVKNKDNSQYTFLASSIALSISFLALLVSLFSFNQNAAIMAPSLYSYCPFYQTLAGTVNNGVIIDQGITFFNFSFGNGGKSPGYVTNITFTNTSIKAYLSPNLYGNPLLIGGGQQQEFYLELALPTPVNYTNSFNFSIKVDTAGQQVLGPIYMSYVCYIQSCTYITLYNTTSRQYNNTYWEGKYKLEKGGFWHSC